MLEAAPQSFLLTVFDRVDLPLAGVHPKHAYAWHAIRLTHRTPPSLTSQREAEVGLPHSNSISDAVLLRFEGLLARFNASPFGYTVQPFDFAGVVRFVSLMTA